MIYIFVEGSTDEIFINNVFGKILRSKYEDFRIVQYAKQTPNKIKNFIKSIDSMNLNYIFLADQDGNVNKKDKILRERTYLKEERVLISVYEIESWIIAGVSCSIQKIYKIKNLNNTENITKEKFESLMPRNCSKHIFISEILNEYDLESAIKKNKSLCDFYECIKKEQANDCF